MAPTDPGTTWRELFQEVSTIHATYTPPELPLSRRAISRHRDLLDKLCEEYVRSSEADRAELRSLVRPEFATAFLGFAALMAVESLRHGDKESLFRGFIALAMENGAFDWRDTLSPLSLLFHAGDQLAVDYQDLWQRLRPLATGTTLQHIQAFQNRAASTRGIAAFGWRVISGPDGVDFAAIAAA